MQILTINSLPDYGVLALIVVSLLGVGFMIWFLIALLLDVRRADRRLTTIYVARREYSARDFDKRADRRRFQAGD
jgi:hypothetical protein